MRDNKQPGLSIADLSVSCTSMFVRSPKLTPTKVRVVSIALKMDLAILFRLSSAAGKQFFQLKHGSLTFSLLSVCIPTNCYCLQQSDTMLFCCPKGASFI